MTQPSARTVRTQFAIPIVVAAESAGSFVPLKGADLAFLLFLSLKRFSDPGSNSD